MTDGPFHRWLKEGDVSSEGKDVSIEAGDDEREALARDLKILDVRDLKADFRLRRLPGGAINVRGEVRGRPVQTCVVTLDPVEESVVEAVDVTLVPAERHARSREREVIVDPEGEDGPEVYANGLIDLGAIAAEHLALGLDPYPRKGDARFETHEEDRDPSPFAPLSSILSDEP